MYYPAAAVGSQMRPSLTPMRGSSLILSSLMAFFSGFVSVTLAILRGSWSMATTAAAHLSVFTEKLRLTLRTVAYVSYIYLDGRIYYKL